MFEQFASGARTVVTAALDEARHRGDRRVGTEHLLLGVLRLPDTPGTQALGVDLATARAALDALDREALAVVGVDVAGLDRPPIPASRKRTPFTSAARGVIPRSLVEARKSSSRRITAEHLLLAILEREQPDPAADLLAHLGVDRKAVTQRVRQAIA
ncbi:Clp protease N-terminal domain-containing protein [Catenulispora yoronensis]|uniref:Clp protease N-terminal domain-containing protein n=1 Tax=Catenulispora yoronensis TaxID=450799 RepID=A0ABP5EZI1_9ACTN